MSAASGILIRPVGQAFRVEQNFVDSGGNAVTAGTAAVKAFEVQQDGTLRAVDFLTSPLAGSVPIVKALATDVPIVATLALANQTCAAVAQPLWTATFPVANLTVGALYLLVFTVPSGATPTNPKLVQYGGSDGDGATAKLIWDYLLAGVGTAGSVGKLLKDYVDIAISSRLAPSGYVAPDNTGIAAIKAKTDNLPADPASNTQVNTRASASVQPGWYSSGGGGGGSTQNVVLDAGVVAASPAPTVSRFNATGAELRAPTGGYVRSRSSVLWQTGGLANGRTKYTITEHTVNDDGSVTFAVAPAMPFAPSSGDGFVIG